MGHISRDMEDSVTESTLNCEGLAPGFPEEKIFSMFPRECSFDILLKYVADVYPCLTSLHHAKLKIFRLSALTNRVSKKPSFDFVLWFTLMRRVFIKHSKLRKENHKMYGSKTEGKPGRMEINYAFKDIK